MSDRDFIAWSLAFGGALALLGFAIDRAGKYFRWGERLRAARDRRLQRRLDRRMARGHDNYFEELRSIELAIAQHQAVLATPKGRFAPAYAVLTIAFCMLAGLLLTNLLVHPVLGVDAPKWSDHWVLAWIPVTGVQNLLDSFQPGEASPWGKRGWAVLLIVVGGLMVLDQHPA